MVAIAERPLINSPSRITLSWIEPNQLNAFTYNHRYWIVRAFLIISQNSVVNCAGTDSIENEIFLVVDKMQFIISAMLQHCCKPTLFTTFSPTVKWLISQGCAAIENVYSVEHKRLVYRKKNARQRQWSSATWEIARFQVDAVTAITRNHQREKFIHSPRSK